MNARIFPLVLVISAALLVPWRAPAQATFGDLELFGAFVPPNVMFLIDNSDAMNHHLWNNDFDPNVLYPAFVVGVCAPWPQAPTISGSSCPGSGAFRCNSGADVGNVCAVDSDCAGGKSLCVEECVDNEFVWRGLSGSDKIVPHTISGSSTQFHTECGVTRQLFHDDTSTPSSLYSLNYLNWMYGLATAGELADEPLMTRFQAAKTMIKGVLLEINPGSELEQIRVGLADFDSGGAVEGGSIKESIGKEKTNPVISQIDGLNANASGAPLAEALVDVGRYYAGKGNPMGDFSTHNLASPIDSSCRQNFVVLITAGAPTEDLMEHHSGDFETTIGNYDLDANECLKNQAPPACTTALEWDAPSTGRDDLLMYNNNGSDWLDDVAAYLLATDLSPDFAGTQNVKTYTIGFLIDHPLLAETAINGDGEYYTTDPQNAFSMADQLREALINIIERATSFGSAAVPSSRTAFGDGFYNAYFIPLGESSTWDGHLEAYRLANDGTVRDASGAQATNPVTGEFNEPRNPIWDSGEVIITQTDNDSRSIFTTIGGVQVDWNDTNVGRVELDIQTAELTQYANYDTSGITDPNDPIEVADAIADGLVHFTHGHDGFDEDLDGDYDETRTYVLGDIFHSSPVVVGPPPTFLFHEEGFGVASRAAPTDTPFYEQFETRDRIIYAGANDGMLHGFDGGEFLGDDPDTAIVETHRYTMGTGEERFGYVPGLLLDKIKYLPRNLPRQWYYVDGPAVAADAWLGDGTAGDITKEPGEWATVLLVGFRQGGPGYLALDISDPDETTAAHSPYPKLLWEFTHPNLGETWSKPVITRIKTVGAAGTGDKCGKDDGDGDCKERWVAIFGGGYTTQGNPNLATFIGDPADASWSDRSRAVFMVDLESGALVDSIEFDASGIDGPDNMIYAVPGQPSVLDLDFDGFADLVYLGDLGGQLWKWDISALGEDTDLDGLVDNWPSGVFFYVEPGSLGGSDLHYKNIFKAPAAAFHDGELVLAFGTGERDQVNFHDPDNSAHNFFVVAKDPNPTGAGAFPVTLPYLLDDVTDITSKDDDFDLTDLGFYVEGAEAEKFVTNTAIFAGFVITSSFVPDLVSVDVCDKRGSGNLYVFSLFTGQGFYYEAKVTTQNDARQTSIGTGMPSDPKVVLSPDGDQLYIQTSDNRLVTLPPPPRDPEPVKIVYWKQNF
jgi:type IV pilus assembly protein PilY1